MPASATALQLQQRLQQPEPTDLLDVRTPKEFNAVHVQGARLIPLDQLTPQAVTDSRPANAQGPVWVLCHAGGRAKQACEKLEAAGIDCQVVEGGTQACVQAGLPLVEGKPSFSIERQVRLIAGLLVLTGTLLGAFIHPLWLIVPGFVGSGLAFAGLTNTCGMAMLLLKCPWNR